MKYIKVLIFATVMMLVIGTVARAQVGFPADNCPGGKCSAVKPAGGATTHSQPQHTPTSSGASVVRLRHMPILVAAVHRVASLPVRVCCRLRCR